MAAEKRVVSKLLAPSETSEKTYPIDNHICCLVAGFSSDANTLVQEARVGAQRLDACNHNRNYLYVIIFFPV